MTARRKAVFGLAAAFLLIPAAARADVVWPALLLEPRFVSVPVAAAGFAIEAVVLHLFFAMRWTRALLASAAVNVISAFAGLCLIPLFGLGWSLVPGVGFVPLAWAVTF